MIKAAGKAGWLDESRAMLESLLAIKRAGAGSDSDLLRERRGAVSPLTMTFTVTRDLGDVRSRPHPVVTIGNFDGHHRGHQSLLQTVVERARAVTGTAMVLTFDPHPVRVLAPHVELRFLTSPEEKLARFKAAGIDEVVFLEFTPALAAMTPEEFADIVLHRRLRVSDVYVGEHFAFGRGRAGRIADLVRYGRTLGFTVHPVKPVMLNGGVVSSTRIRTFIQAGRMDEAAVLLGRAYGITGTVVRGRRRDTRLVDNSQSADPSGTGGSAGWRLRRTSRLGRQGV